MIKIATQRKKLRALQHQPFGMFKMGLQLPHFEDARAALPLFVKQNSETAALSVSFPCIFWGKYKLLHFSIIFKMIRFNHHFIFICKIKVTLKYPGSIKIQIFAGSVSRFGRVPEHFRVFEQPYKITIQLIVSIFILVEIFILHN